MAATRADVVQRAGSVSRENSVADVLIVGSGASGSVAAARLAGAGFEVVCLEQGDWAHTADYMSATPEAELAWVQRWSPDPNARRNPADYPLTGDADRCALIDSGAGPHAETLEVRVRADQPAAVVDGHVEVSSHRA